MKQNNSESIENEAVQGDCGCSHCAAATADISHSHSNSHSHGTSDEEGIPKDEILRLVFGAVLFAGGLIAESVFQSRVPMFALFAASYLVTGLGVVVDAIKNIARGRFLDENFLMSLATIGAFAVGQYPEAVAVMLFYRAGELFESLAVNHSRKSIKSLLALRPEAANLITGSGTERVSPEKVAVGCRILVKAGERVPLDSIVLEGSSFMDTSALTGESVPRSIQPGDELLGGYINGGGMLVAEVTRPFGESAVMRILKLVESAASKKAPVEKFITRFARYYTPAVVIAALAAAFLPPILTGSLDFRTWIYRALIFLVISCPCALVLSVPLSFFAGIGKASSNGILVKGGNYLDALNSVDTVVFDKTGTLTKGVFKVTRISPAVTAASADAADSTAYTVAATTDISAAKAELLRFAALAEKNSIHPIAHSILEAYGSDMSAEAIESHLEIPGSGVKAVSGGKIILAGNLKLMESEGIRTASLDSGAGNCGSEGSTVHVAVDGRYLGSIIVSDELKTDAEAAVKGLRSLGVKRLVMLTGDSDSAAKSVAEALKLDEYHVGLLPEQKAGLLEDIRRKASGKVLFAGDGINDAPVLALADIGVSMGSLGSGAAVEASDIVLMKDEPSSLIPAIQIARITKSIAVQNIVFALGIKAIVLVLGAAGLANMWEAVFADVGVAVLAILNSLRVMSKRLG